MSMVDTRRGGIGHAAAHSRPHAQPHPPFLLSLVATTPSPPLGSLCLDRHGAGKIAQRLQATFESLQSYFEETLLMEPAEWIALVGAHTAID